MGASSVPRLSGMQKQVLALYRGFLRAARTKSPEERQQIVSFVSSEFRRNSKQVDRKNFQYIEYLLRLGKKQLDQLKSPDTTGLSSLRIKLVWRKKMHTLTFIRDIQPPGHCDLHALSNREILKQARHAWSSKLV